jgi:formate C-acetyltransferase
MPTTVRTLRAARIHARVMKEMMEGRRFWQCPPMEFAEEFVSQPLIVRKARALEKVLTEMPIAIREEELFAGTMVIPGDPPMKVGGSFPNYATEEERAAAAKQGLSIHSVFGHIVPDYWRLLEKGLGGIRRDAETKLVELEAPIEMEVCRCSRTQSVRTRLRGLGVESAQADFAATAPDFNRGRERDKRAFLQAVILSGKAVVRFAHRHAELAERRAAEARSPRQRREFLQIAEHCWHVPENPPLQELVTL